MFFLNLEFFFLCKRCNVSLSLQCHCFTDIIHSVSKVLEADRVELFGSEIGFVYHRAGDAKVGEQKEGNMMV